ncbi:G-protein coupled receptor [Emericellopsis atlantica]|uniref:G-protein coupled receptor n=1 Tax=Emericellopsis atlantica TaxID=2614577 RepID=A0A9P8CSX5_9HYPO|nr:G-protein coupled receptor [Emericellopsis atlantica]KAG9257817.1 G-protein coupled receptor [Emericellopsis atlantica]
MANLTLDGVNLCPPPFYDVNLFGDGGFTEGRICQRVSDELSCCLPCPMTQWVYPDTFNTLTDAANWVATASGICCLFLLASWACLPVEKTNRHYLSVGITIGVLLMSFGFIIPLAAQTDQCYDKITPHSMHTNPSCGASGAFLLLGGWAGVMWAFLRSLSLHLQICWQVLVGRNFMIFAQAAGWGVPALGLVLALVFSGVSFRFGETCHINHTNSMEAFWIPLLIFAGATVVITFATFGYCIKVYLSALGDSSASTEGSNLPTHSSIARSHYSPRQAYRRVSRVIGLQWRGIAIVLIIIADVIFFSIVFVFQDSNVESATGNPKTNADWNSCVAEAGGDKNKCRGDTSKAAEAWSLCLIGSKGDKDKCLSKASSLVVNQATVGAVLLLLTLNGLWVLFLLGRWSMVMGWVDLIPCIPRRRRHEFVSADARHDDKQETRAYEMLSKDTNVEITPLSPVMKSPPEPEAGRSTPDYFGTTARYHAPSHSYSSPRPPSPPRWNPNQTFATSQKAYHAPHYDDMNPLGMNRL